MDWLSLIGMMLGVAAIVLGNIAEGGLTSALINGPAQLDQGRLTDPIPALNPVPHQ